MGSGAFLVEACPQLAEALIEAWCAHDAAPPLLPGEDEVIVARRLVAQKCLYGVDRNPVAVGLAKMSLWLATLARNHPLLRLARRFPAAEFQDNVCKSVRVGHPDGRALDEELEAVQARTSWGVTSVPG